MEGVCVMSCKVKDKARAPARKEPCRHYWVIEVANGPVSQGVCKYCGAEKEFFNAIPEFNPMKKNNSPLNLPKLSGVKVDEKSKS